METSLLSQQISMLLGGVHPHWYLRVAMTLTMSDYDRLTYHPDYLPTNLSTNQNFSSTLMPFRKRKRFYIH